MNEWDESLVDTLYTLSNLNEHVSTVSYHSAETHESVNRTFYACGGVLRQIDTNRSNRNGPCSFPTLMVVLRFFSPHAPPLVHYVGREGAFVSGLVLRLSLQ
jgi:hypothetical protein